MIELLTGLNAKQREAATHADGPLLIVAGVGTGKTTVITQRIAWLIAEKRAEPSEILALTFTERAAAEMEERVDRLVPYGYVEAQIGTFHAFCDRLLRENAILLGLNPDYRILTEAEQAIFLKEHLFDLPLSRLRPLGNPLRNLRALLTLFSRAKDEDVSPEAYQSFVDELAIPSAADEAQRRIFEDRRAEQNEIARTYAAYQALLIEHGRVDFGDLIMHALRILRTHPAVLERYRNRFRYILVDEFQDTNYAQFELLKLLASHRNLTVCGDDDQSIYKFRGASISNILGFREAYPDAHLVVLDQNYRSTQSILDAAYRLIRNNNPDRLEVREGISKRLRADAGPGHGPHQRHFETLDDETDFVAETIARRVEDEGLRYADFAILIRSNAQATPFLNTLNLLKIPWRFSGSRGLYDQDEIRTMIAFLRILADPRDNLSLHYLASSPLYGIQGETLATATSTAQRQNRSLLEVFRGLASGTLTGADPAERAVLLRFVEDLAEMIELSTHEKTGEVLYQYLSVRTGTIERLSNSEEPGDAMRIQNIARLFSIVDRFAHVARYDRVPWFVDYLDALIEAGDNPPVGDATWDEDAVSVMTIHQAKGLEFPVVFMVGLLSGRFPSSHRQDPLPLPDELVKELLSGSDFHRQEERRLFYVAMTRAKRDLYLTSAQDYGGKRPRKPSLFVSEALDLDASQLAPRHRDPLTALRRHAQGRDTERPPASPQDGSLAFPPGDRILSLSHRQIDDYLTCPLKYRYIHLLRVPIRQHHAVIYGNAIHQAIRLYNLNRLAGRPTELPVLQDVFRAHWMAEGFLTRRHEELRLHEGLEALRFFRTFEEREGGTPTYVERRFSVMEGDVRLVGVFDRIDVIEDRGTIIDYKTSSVADAEQAAKRAEDSLQLALYALAYDRLFGTMPVSLQLRFLTPEVMVGAASPTAKQLAKAQAAITTAAAGIRSAAFPGEPAYKACNYCPYASICPSVRYD